MDIKLDKKLFKKYPLLYGGHRRSVKDSLMCFGFECGNGWYDIIDSLSASLEAINLQLLEAGTDAIEAMQVKEKYGTLRFYTNYGFADADKLISQAEALSGKTCEDCGKPGKLRGDHWVNTLCEKCWKKASAK